MLTHHSFTIASQTDDYAILECGRCGYRTSDIEYENAAVLGRTIPDCKEETVDIAETQEIARDLTRLLADIANGDNREDIAADLKEALPNLQRLVAIADDE